MNIFTKANSENCRELKVKSYIYQCLREGCKAAPMTGTRSSFCGGKGRRTDDRNKTGCHQ